MADPSHSAERIGGTLIDTVYIPEEGAGARLAAWLASSDGPALAHLYDNNPAYNPQRVLADYQESAFTGYAAVGPLGWGGVSTNPQGKAQGSTSPLLWTFTAGAGTAVVYGMYLTDDPPTVLLAVIPFLDAIVLTPGSPNLVKSVRLTDVSEL